MRTSRASTVTSLATLAGLTFAFAPAAPSAQSDASLEPLPPRSEHFATHFPSKDGTMLQADVLLPEGGCPDEGCATVVSVGPYFGYATQDLLGPDPLNTGPSARFSDFTEYEIDGRNIFDDGYAFVMVDSRGYGESGGCSDYGGRGEQSDVYAAVEWAGTQSWSSGEVGMWGKSYDAWTQVMGLSENPPHLEAVVIQAPIIDGFGIAFVNGVHHDTGWYLTPGLYNAYDYAPTSIPEALRDPNNVVYPTAGTATDPCWAENHPHSAAGFDRDLEYWRQRDLRPSAGRNDDVAVLWSHGFNDVNTKSDQIFGVYGPIQERNEDVRAWFGGWAHDRGNEWEKVGRAGFMEEARDWLDHYLKGEPFEYEANAQKVVEVQDNYGDWRTEASYPPADTIVTPIELNTGSYVDDGGSATSHGYWTVSQPVLEDTRIVGEPTLTVAADFPGPYANFIGVLYDLAPYGVATEIARTAVFLEKGQEHTVQMHPRDHVLRPGHKLAFHVTSNHVESNPISTRQTVNVTKLVIGVPFLQYHRVINLDGTQASSSAFNRNAGSLLTAPTKTFPFPDVKDPLPPKRKELQPEVSTGYDDAPAEQKKS